MGTEAFKELNAAAEALSDMRAFAAWERQPAPAELDTSAIWSRLFVQMQRALINDPARRVPTPAWGVADSPAVEVVSDSFAGKLGEASLLELLQIVGAAARGVDVRQSSLDWINSVSTEYAAWHFDDAMTEGDE